jgi:hypothetical protein
VRLDVEDDMRLKTSVIQSDMSRLSFNFQVRKCNATKIKYVVRSVQCKILKKISALDLCLMSICKQQEQHVGGGGGGKGSSSV